MSKGSRKPIVLVVVGFLVVCGLIFVAPQSIHKTQAAASTCNWTNNAGAGDNKWSTATNWDCGHVPDSTYDVVLNSTSNYALTIDTAATAGSFTVNAGYSQIITADASLTLSTSSAGTGSFIMSAGTYTANSTTLTIPGSWDVSAAIFTQGGSTVSFTTAAAGKTVKSGTNQFNILTFNGTAPGAWLLSDNLKANSFTLNSGTLTDNGKTVTIYGDIMIASSTQILFSTGSWTQAASGILSNSKYNNWIRNLTISGPGVTTTLTGDVNVGNQLSATNIGLTIGSGTLYGAGHILTLSNYSASNVLAVNNPTMGSALSKFFYYNFINNTISALTTPNGFATSFIFESSNDTSSITASGNLNFGDSNVNHYEVGKTGAAVSVSYLDMATFSLTTTGVLWNGYSNMNGYIKLSTSTAHSVGGIVMGTGTAGKLEMSSSTLTSTGNVAFTGISVTSASSTLIMSGSNKTLTPNSNTLNNLGVAGSVTLSGDLSLNGYLTIDFGKTFNITNRTVNVVGNLSNSGGTLTSTGSTVNLTGAGGSTQTVSGSTTFNNLSATSSSARTIRYTDGTTQIVSGTWTQTGAAGQLITLTGTSAAGWTVIPTASVVNYADISYSTNNGTIICAQHSQSTNGNNGGTGGWELTAGTVCSVPALAAPTITNNTSGIGVTFNSNIVYTGGENASERGFNLYSGSDNTCAGTVLLNVKDNGSYGTGAYAKNSGEVLTKNTDYFFTAYAINSAGTGTSTCRPFTTVSNTTYYVRADGTVTCANKTTASSPNSASTALSMAEANACTFLSADKIYFSSQGGVYATALVIPSGGSGAGSEITYASVNSEVPVITAATDGFVNNTSARSNFVVDGLTMLYSGGANTYRAVLIESGSNITFKNITASMTGYGALGNGITIGGTANNVTINDSTTNGRTTAFTTEGSAYNVTFNRDTASSSTGSAFSSKGASHDVVYNNCVGTASGTSGFDTSESAYNVTYNDCDAHDNTANGFASLNNTHDVSYYRCKAYFNGYHTLNSNGTGFIPHDNATNINTYDSLAYDNFNSGIGDVSTGNNLFYNCVSWRNGHVLGDIWKGDAATLTSVRGNMYFNKTAGMDIVKNTISGVGKPRERRDVHPNYMTYDYNIYQPLDNSKFTSADNITDASWADYHSANEAHSQNADPQFVSTVTPDFHIQSLSPAIDAGLDLDINTDYAGNPIYGTPDMGVYEYQPPHTTGTNGVDIGAGARIYGDGKFRDLNTTSGSTADLSISPSGGSFPFYSPTETRPAWLDISAIAWSNTGTYHKVWTESSAVSGLTNTIHTIGDLEANKYYDVKVDDVLGANITGEYCTAGKCLANSSGKITFTYTGGYSTHTFDIESEPATVVAPVIPSDSSTPTTPSKLTAKFPDTGVNPSHNNIPRNIIMLSGALALISISLIVFLRKRRKILKV